MQKLHHTTPPAGEAGEDLQREIAAADRAFCDAIARGDAGGAARNVYTEDAVILPPGAEMVRGREAIAAFWRDAAAQMNLQHVELTTVALVPAGDYVHQIGRAVLTVGGQKVEGKYTMLWKREDGSWRWHVDCWNLNS